MKRFERILLSTRARKADASAVRWAFALARRQSAQLSLADCLDGESTGAGPASGDLLRQSRLRRRRRELEGLLEGSTFRKRPIICALNGGRTEGILRLLAAGDHDLALIDLERHGEVGLAGEDLERLQAESPIPLLFIRSAQETGPRRIAVAIDPTNEERAFARRMLDYGRSLAQEAGTQLVVISAWTPFGLDLLGNRDVEAGAALVERCRFEVESRQRELVAEAGIDPDEIHLELRRGSAPEVLPAFCAANAIDLLVIGHKGRQGISRAIFGNTAESVLARAPASILTVPAARFGVLKKRLRSRAAALDDQETIASGPTS